MKYKFFLLCISFLMFETTCGKCSPCEVSFLFDIHDTFLEKDPQRVIKALWNYDQKLKTVSNLSFLKRLATLGWHHFTDQEITSGEFIQAALDHGDNAAAQLIKSIANAQKPITGTVEVLQELYDHGYKLHIGSNISPEVFDELRDPSQHPELAHIFELFDLSKSQISEQRPNGTIVKKPQFRFYMNYLKRNNKNPETVFFIDDIEINVEAAKRLGFEAIHFQNPEQLREELSKRGFKFLEKNIPELQNIQ